MYSNQDFISQPQEEFVLPNPFPGLDTDPDELLALLASGDQETLLNKIFDIIGYFNASEINALLAEQKEFLNRLVEAIFKVFLTENLQTSPAQALLLVRSSVIFSNMFAASKFKNSDAVLAQIRTQKNNMVRMLTLTSFRNKAIPNPEALFASQPVLSSLWLSSMLGYANSSNSEHIFKVVKGISEHPAFLKGFTIPDFTILTAFPEICALYFRANYITDSKDKEIRECITSEVKKIVNGAFEPAAIRPSQDVKNIGVFSSKLTIGNSVYRAMKPLLRSLKGKYKITYFHLELSDAGVDRELFDDVVVIKEKRGNIIDFIAAEEEAIKRNIGTALFADIGLSYESIMLASRRFAPIQIGCYGHPASSNGLEVDFYIGGADVEKIESATKNYSERLVTTPGFAQGATIPDYQALRLAKEANAKVISINWGNTKFFYPQLQLVKKLVMEAKDTVAVVFLGLNSKRLEFAATVNELRDIFAEKGEEWVKGNLLFSQTLPYAEYMGLLENSHIALDSYPFGSFTRIIDAVHVKLPVLTMKGEKAYNRVASTILEKLSLPELVANNEQEYFEKAKRLLEDDAHYRHIQTKMANVSLKNLFPDTDANFAKAIDFIIENHAKLKADGSMAAIELK